MKPIRAFLFLLTVLSLFILSSILLDGKMNVNVFMASSKENPVKNETQNKNETTNQSSGLNTSAPIIQIIADTNEKVSTNPVSFIFSKNDTAHFNYLETRINEPNFKTNPIHILYFGDSQIEGDRITSTLRKNLQTQWGGSGPGLIPADEYYNTKHQLIINLSDDWEIKTFQDEGFTNQSITFRNSIITGKAGSSWIRIGRIKSLNPQPDYTQVIVYYTTKDTCYFHATESGRSVYNTTFSPTQEVKNIKLSFSETPENLKLNFTPNDSLTILGLSLESPEGIMTDNVSLRGETYPDFTNSNQLNLKEMLANINPGLFIFHYGVNLVPYTSENYNNYRNQFSKQILFIKKEFPDVPVLIIGVSDMAKITDGNISSYSNIEQIKAIQEQIADETHSVFWDLEDFMGGSGSIIKWVNTNTPLATRDYVHFTEEGAELVGDELARRLINELVSNNETLTWSGN